MGLKKDGSINIGLSPEAQKLLNAYVAKNIVVKKDAISRLIEWFVRQDEKVQAICMSEGMANDPAIYFALAVQRPEVLREILSMALEVGESVDQQRRKPPEAPPRQGRAGGR